MEWFLHTHLLKTILMHSKVTQFLVVHHGPVISFHNHCPYLHIPHSWAHPWHIIVVKKISAMCIICQILFCSASQMISDFHLMEICVGGQILPFLLDLMMALNIYLYKLMTTNGPFCPVCLPDPDTSLSFFVGTLQKYTVTEHWQKQQNILPR